MTWQKHRTPRKSRNRTWKEPVYHGTTAERAGRIQTEGFKQTESLRMMGFIPLNVNSPVFFFTADPKVAWEFANNRAERPQDAAVVRGKINMSNPIDLTNEDAVIDVMERLRDDYDIPDSTFKGAGLWPNTLEFMEDDENKMNWLWKLLDDKKVVDALTSMGYDSAIVPESFNSTSYAVFSPSQVEITKVIR